MINLTEKQEKEIVDFYLKPSSLSETRTKFNFKSDRVVKRVLDKYNIPLHTKQVMYACRTESTKKSNLLKYGVENTSSLESTKAKRNATNLTRYGGTAPACSEEVRQKMKNTCLNKYGVENAYQAEECKNKIKTTSLAKYGSTSYMQSQQARATSAKREEKKKQTCLDKYGTEYYVQSTEYYDTLADRLEKTKQTNISRYGVESVLQNQEILSKKDNTCLERYGTKNYTSTNEYLTKSKATCIAKYGCEYATQNEEVKAKANDTKRNRGSFNKSVSEENFYAALLNVFDRNDIIRQYKESRYPFACDFYIKSLDLFIELNLHWTHGFHPFDKNNKKDIEQVDTLKQLALTKGSRFYSRALYVWTDLDPRKVKTAIKNNLNYKMFYTEEDALLWLKLNCGGEA